MANRILVERLAEFVDPWAVLDIPPGQSEGPVQTDHIEPMDREQGYHQARVRYFVQQIATGKPLDPIAIDNVCSAGCILPEPLIIDGHHRLIAAILCKQKFILCEYGGRMDVLRYLQGKRKTAPEGWI